MRTRNVALSALVCLIAAIGAAGASDKSDIAALYKKLEKAMIAKDVKGIMAIGTKDFSYTEAGKTLTTDKMTSQLEQQFSMVAGTPKWTNTIVSCKVKGKKATVVTTDYSEMQMSMQDGKPHTIVSSGKSTDTLVKTAGGWL